MKLVVFTGPTIQPAVARLELDADYRPPAAQGDVTRAAAESPRPDVIAIVDGLFESVPSVWHKEILWAMSRGIHVFGGASMGALRAAELAAFGMEGVGAVFEAFARGELEDDDEVAVRHGPEESGFRAASEAMVNIRATFARAEAESVISRAVAAALTAIAKSLHYPDRAYPPILERARAAGLASAELDRLAAWLPAGRVDQKRSDAIAMLRTVRARAAAGLLPKEVAYEIQPSKYWMRALREALQPAPEPEPFSIRAALRRARAH